MGKQLKNLTFEEWLSYVFDHPVPADNADAWYWAIDRDEWREDPADAIRFMTRAFEHAADVLQPYSDAQLNQGLWFIVSNSCSNHMLALLDASVPWPAQKRCISSIHQLYEQCFARRCSPHSLAPPARAGVSHLDEPGANPLNLVCYMWWDIMPIHGHPGDPVWKEMDEDILRVIESTLQLDSIACRESALHGLGQWRHSYPERVGEIINNFSMSHRDLPKNLEQYMINAFTGYVL